MIFDWHQHVVKNKIKLCGNVRDQTRPAEPRPRRGEGGKPPPGLGGLEDQIGKENSSEDRKKRGGLYTQTWYVGGLYKS